MRALDGIVRRREQLIDQRTETEIVEVPRGKLVDLRLQQMRLMRAPDQHRRQCVVDRDVDDRSTATQRVLDNLGGASRAARRQPVPNRDEHITMRHGCAPGESVCRWYLIARARQLEDARGPAKQPLVRRKRGGFGEIDRVIAAAKRQDCMKLIAKVERRIGGNLVDTLGERTDQPRRQGDGCENAGRGPMQSRRCIAQI
nr:hypothetical protein [Polymorphobacter sp.]